MSLARGNASGVMTLPVCSATAAAAMRIHGPSHALHQQERPWLRSCCRRYRQPGCQRRLRLASSTTTIGASSLLASACAPSSSTLARHTVAPRFETTKSTAPAKSCTMTAASRLLMCESTAGDRRSWHGLGTPNRVGRGGGGGGCSLNRQVKVAAATERSSTSEPSADAGKTPAGGGDDSGRGGEGKVAAVSNIGLGELFKLFREVATPYWSSDDKVQARWRLAAVFLFALATTGVSVTFNFLGRDFYNALESKNEEVFFRQLLWYLGAFAGGIPVYVMRDYLRDSLSLRWRAWMTSDFLSRYMSRRTFYAIQSQMLVDNPDQRLNDDVRVFTTTALAFSLSLFGAVIDLVSFSGILFSIYPPLFAVLIAYSLGGTAISVALGKDLVGLNFQQEKKEADFRYGLVRVRENAESIAFYGGETSEIRLLLQRFRESFANYAQLLLVGRNLDFFTSFYRYLIQLLPAAVVAPLFFRGEVEFGVINQSFSAFNHVLSDFSIIVYQFQSLSSFAAIVERLGEFNQVLDNQAPFHAEEEAAETQRESQNGAAAVAAATAAAAVTAGAAATTVAAPSPKLSEASSTAEGDETIESAAAVAAATKQQPSIILSDAPFPLLSPSATTAIAAAVEAADVPTAAGAGTASHNASKLVLLELKDVTLFTPRFSARLVDNLSLTVRQGQHLLIMGPSGVGKTSLLRAIAGLWRAGRGHIIRYVNVNSSSSSSSNISSSGSGNEDSGSGNTSAHPQDSSATVHSLSSSLSSLSSSSKSSLPSSSSSSSESSESHSESGSVSVPAEPTDAGGSIFFVPQRPYMVLGTLRQQLLYPTWNDSASGDGTVGATASSSESPAAAAAADGGEGSPAAATVTSDGISIASFFGRQSPPAMVDAATVIQPQRQKGQLPPDQQVQERATAQEEEDLDSAEQWAPHNALHRPVPSDEQLLEVLEKVRLGHLASRSPEGLDAEAEWSSVLSLGEQQRLAFARLLLSRPLLALMDESTSALDEDNESRLYEAVEDAGVTFVSVGHRRSLSRFHTHLLRLRPLSEPSEQSGAAAGSGLDMTREQERLGDSRSAASSLLCAWTVEEIADTEVHEPANPLLVPSRS